MDFVERTRLFTEELKESGLYRDYTSAKARIMEEPEIYERVCEFMAISGAYRLKSLESGDESFDETRRIGNVYWGLMRNETARAFLEAEREVVRMYRAVVDAVIGSCGVEL